MSSVVPDLPGHGRSTGLHAYVTDVLVSVRIPKPILTSLAQMRKLAEAVDAAICAVALRDMEGGKTEAEIDARSRYICGASLGGFTALLYTMFLVPAGDHNEMLIPLA